MIEHESRDHPKSDFGNLIVESSGSTRRTQRRQIRLNPSPNESKSRTRTLLEGSNHNLSYQTGRAYSRIERLDKTNPTSPRSLNSDNIKTSKCLSNGP
ncbi:hypothetical protein M5K25_002747 [Dendrobium thyrsiflorum]|uniref:Uncharacterized protein n=1 Tax=Dendrobium thyrsiflorum TaxID=117978 RepID=A0ABD0VP06_DENTH